MTTVVPPAKQRRFLQLDDVAEELSTTRAQIYALVRSDELAAIKVGGRGQWRVERVKLEEFIERMYAETKAWVLENPLVGTTADGNEP